MENNIKFKKGDWVCMKEVVSSPFSGAYSNDIKDIRPWVVMDIIEDRDWDNRVGELGCANVYRLGDYNNTGFCAERYQYELQAWSDIKERVIQKLEKELETLKAI